MFNIKSNKIAKKTNSDGSISVTYKMSCNKNLHFAICTLTPRREDRDYKSAGSRIVTSRQDITTYSTVWLTENFVGPLKNQISKFETASKTSLTYALHDLNNSDIANKINTIANSI